MHLWSEAIVRNRGPPVNESVDSTCDWLVGLATHQPPFAEGVSLVRGGVL